MLWNHGTFRIASWAGIALLALTLLALASERNWTGVGVIGPFLLFSAAFTLSRARIPSLFSLSFTLASLMGAAGFRWNLYERFVYFDDLAHAYSGLATTVTLGVLLLHPLEKAFARHRMVYLIALCAVGVTIGVGWEFFEWAVDYTRIARVKLLGTIDDTLRDLAMDVLGAGIGALIAVRRVSERPAPDQAAWRSGGVNAGISPIPPAR